MLIPLRSAGSLDLVEVSVKEIVLMLLQHSARTIYAEKLWFTNYKPKCFCPVRFFDPQYLLEESINMLQFLNGGNRQGQVESGATPFGSI